jgi:dGTP triphosphohydrolase
MAPTPTDESVPARASEWRELRPQFEAWTEEVATHSVEDVRYDPLWHPIIAQMHDYDDAARYALKSIEDDAELSAEHERLKRELAAWRDWRRDLELPFVTLRAAVKPFFARYAISQSEVESAERERQLADARIAEQARREQELAALNAEREAAEARARTAQSEAAQGAALAEAKMLDAEAAALAVEPLVPVVPKRAMPAPAQSATEVYLRRVQDPAAFFQDLAVRGACQAIAGPVRNVTKISYAGIEISVNFSGCRHLSPSALPLRGVSVIKDADVRARPARKRA